ncbi:MAG: RND transporter, partial [Pseudomonas gingeri]
MTDQSQCKVPLAAQRLETIRGSRLLSVALCGLMLSACAVGPDYKRPEAAAPAQYKEAAGWRQAQPSDSLARGAWWELYGDPTLNGLVEKLNNANQTVAQSEAQYRQALALVKSSTGAFFPT